MQATHGAPTSLLSFHTFTVLSSVHSVPWHQRNPIPPVTVKLCFSHQGAPSAPVTTGPRAPSSISHHWANYAKSLLHLPAVSSCIPEAPATLQQRTSLHTARQMCQNHLPCPSGNVWAGSPQVEPSIHPTSTRVGLAPDQIQTTFQ